MVRYPRPVQHFSGAETAWLALELARIGLELVALGRCAGELQSSHLVVQEGGRLGRRDRVTSWDHLAIPVHRIRGHDRGCRFFGVSERVLSRVIEHASRPGSAALTHEACRETLDTLHADPGEPVLEELDYQLRRRITPRAPRS